MIVDTTETRTPLRCTRLDQRAEIAVAGEQHDMVEVPAISIASTASSMSMLPRLDLAAAHRVDEFLVGLVTTE